MMLEDYGSTSTGGYTCPHCKLFIPWNSTHNCLIGVFGVQYTLNGYPFFSDKDKEIETLKRKVFDLETRLSNLEAILREANK